MRLSITSLFLIIPFLKGCGPSCSFAYSPGGATVELVEDAWPPGTYTIEVVGETCDFVLPAPDDSTTNYCESKILRVFPTEDAQGIRMFRITMDPPETFEVVLSLDGVEFQRETVAPDYELSEPHGPGCGEAWYGDAALEIDVPVSR